MSLDRCDLCEGFIDTDNDPDCYQVSGDCHCESCRESAGDVEPDYDVTPFALVARDAQLAAMKLK